MDEVQNVVVQNVVVMLETTWARIKTLEAKKTRHPNVVDDAMSDAYAEMRDDLDRLYLAELESTCNAIVAAIESG